MAVLIDLQNMNGGMPGLSAKKGASMAEAASVCLDENSHVPIKKYLVEGDYTEQFDLDWQKPDEQIKNTWNDLQEATEEGACCLAILVLKELTGDLVLKRSAKGTGVDYYVGNRKDALFQNTARLEVSGILKGDDLIIQKRIKQKMKQTQRTASTGLPAIIAVTDFSQPKTEIVKNG